MVTYDDCVRLSGHFYHSTIFVHSAVDTDGSVRGVGRSESVDRLTAFMSRFWDRHLSRYEIWGSRSSSSAHGVDVFPSGCKRKTVGLSRGDS